MTRVELDAILARIETGSDDAWDELLAALRTRMLSLLRRRGVDPELSEDVVQESLALVWQRLATLRDPERLWSWASSIALNRLRSTVNRARVLEQVPDDAPGLSRDPAKRLIRSEAGRWLDARLAMLHPEHSRALKLRIAEALTPETAARRMRVTRVRLRRLLHQGIRTFRSASWDEGRMWARALGVAG